MNSRKSTTVLLQEMKDKDPSFVLAVTELEACYNKSVELYKALEKQYPLPDEFRFAIIHGYKINSVLILERLEKDDTS